MRGHCAGLRLPGIAELARDGRVAAGKALHQCVPAARVFLHVRRIGGRPGLRPAAAALVDAIADDAWVIAVDVASGLDPDGVEADDDAVWADETVTFGVPKPAHLLPAGEAATGRLTVIDIGLATDDVAAAVERLTYDDVAELWPVARPADDKYSRGVLGIVASRLVERFHRPAFVLGIEDGVAQGSGRSIAPFHLLGALDSMPELFLRYGGHSHAAGLTLLPENVDLFRERLNRYALERLTADDFVPETYIDAVLNFSELTDRAVEQLRRMRGQTLVFQTAVAVVCQATGFAQRDIAPVRVVFRQLDDAAIEAYLQAEQPYDCAGSAKSEGLGIALLEAIDSDDPTALVGLPLIRTCRMLRSAGVELL